MSEIKNSTTDIDNNVQVSVQVKLEYLVQVDFRQSIGALGKKTLHLNQR